MVRDEPQVPGASGDRAAEFLDRALSLNSAARAGFIEEACAGDELLRAELVSLLQAHEAAGDFLAPCNPLEGSGSHVPRATRASKPFGDTIDRYRLEESIGEGGFGVVYRAEQLEPVRRQVAVKVIKLGMDTRQVIARFEAERQALAMMDHPGIAKIFDAGATRSGRPYFAMELVAGDPVTRFCDTQRLNTRGRLRLFIQICHAVQHAHQKGIIHRDIKPSNVLLSRVDGSPFPKIIDFGIAKATHAELTARTLFTEQREVVGTPAYMSPEQAASAGADVDTRSDIYSLGVLLYELLAGTTPFDTTKLLSAGLGEMLRIIREEDPVRPSTRLSALGEEESKIADRRDTDVRRLLTTLRGDLDWIVMKCLEKDRNLRYGSASSLAEDIERYLNDEPVVARAPSPAYRLRKLMRRHRGSVVVVLVIALVLTGATAVSTTFAWRESQQRRRADKEATDARRLAEEARLSQALAEQRAEETRQVAEFQASMLSGLDAAKVGREISNQFRGTLQSALERESIGEWPNRRQRTPAEVNVEISNFDSVVGAIPVADVARRVLDEFLLSSASSAAEKDFAKQPLVQAQIRDSLAAAYQALGLYAQAEKQSRMGLALRRQEVGHESAEIAENLNALAWILSDQGQYANAESLCREALAIQRRLSGEKDVKLAPLLQSLAAALRRQEKYDEAESLYREALAIRRQILGEEHLDVADNLNSLALLLQNKNDYAAAEPLFREALAIRRKLLGEQHSILAGALNNLANLLALRGNRTEAEALLREALDMRRSLLGSEHPDVAQSLHNLGIFLQDNGDSAEAEPYFREAVAIWHKTLSGTHPDTARGLLALGVTLKAQKKFADAEPLFRESLAIKRKTLGDEDSSIPYALNALAALLSDRGDYEQAESAFREIISVYEDRLPPIHRQLGRLGLASTLVKHAAATPDSPSAVAEYLAEAETLLLTADDTFSRSTDGPPAPILVRRCLESLVSLYELRDAAEPDKGYDAKAAEFRAKLQQYQSATSPNSK